MRVYVPASLPANPSMVLFLHGTINCPAPPTACAVPYQQTPQWETMANTNSFLMVWPISVLEPRSNQYYWEAYDTSFSFTAPPDDSGFLRNLITTLTTQYNVNPKAVFVTGMSSGAAMAERVGVELSDLVAAIAVVSGRLYLKQMTDCFSPANPPNPMSVLQLQGDADPVLPYCGQTPKALWNETGLTLPPVDADANFWIAASGTPYTGQSLCTAGSPTAGMNGIDVVGTNGQEYKFVRELNVGHAWLSTTFAAVWQFFAAHPKP
jgi:poly(3-hydroxybutyrate) depolymerase